MAIGNAVQRGALIHIYNEKNHLINTVPAGSGRDDGLVGYTATQVNVRRGNHIYSYDERGRQIGILLAK